MGERGTKPDPKPRDPAWRRVVNRADRLITPPSNALVRTEAFSEVVGTLTRLEQRSRRTVERLTRSVLHLGNLPAASDVRRVSAQLAAVEARVRDLAERLDDSDRERIAAWRQPPAHSIPSGKTSNARSSAPGTGSSTSRESGGRRSG